MSVRSFHRRTPQRTSEVRVRPRGFQSITNGLQRRARAEQLADIERAIAGEGISIVYQPVVELHTGKIAGAEALARFSAQPVRTPDVWFAAAWELGRGIELELAAIRLALKGLESMPAGTYLAVNAAPDTLVHPGLLAILDEVPAHRVVVELTEHAHVEDYEAVSVAVGTLRARGVRLAIDDAGAGFSSLQHILQLRPNLIKLDRTLTRGIDLDPIRNALAGALITFARSLGANICAEGIETATELAALQRLGISHGQGYYIARPAPLPLAIPRASAWPETTRTPLNDLHRLEAIRATGLLDTEPEEAFDRLTRLACSAVGAPVALVSLLDDRRQFFKSVVGSDALKSLREMPVEKTFCQFAVTSKQPLIVDDAAAHALVRPFAEPSTPNMAYAGIPLIDGDQHALGTLCVFTPEARVWTDAEVRVLRDIAGAVVTEIELRKRLREAQATEQRIAASESMVRSVFEQASVGVIIADANGQILRVNSRLRELLGYDERELEGQRLLDIKHPDHVAGDLARRRALLEKGELIDRVETRYRKKDGSYLWMRVTASVVRGPDGVACWTVNVVEDFEEARRLRIALEQKQHALAASEERYRTLVRNMPNTTVSLFDGDLRYTVVDGEGLLDILGMSGDELVGKRVGEVVSPANVEAMERLYRSALLGEEHTQLMQRQDRWLEVHVVPVRDDDRAIVGGMSMTYDVTPIKVTETALVDKTRELERQTSALALLSEIAIDANEASDSEPVLARCLERVARFADWTVGHIYFHVGEILVPSHVWYDRDPQQTRAFRDVTARTRLHRGEGLPGLVLAEGQPQWMRRAPEDERFVRGTALRQSGLASAFAFPIKSGSDVIAVMEFYAPECEPPSADLLAIMANVGMQLGRVMDRERLASEVKAHSVRDEMTQLYNRRGFLELGRRHQQVAARAHHGLGLLFVDLNDLKPINDRLGHEEGDSALCDVADALRAVFADTDVIARLGGDEFVVLSTDTCGPGLDVAQSLVRDTIALYNRTRRRPYHLSVSIGVAEFDPADPRTLEELVAKADERMYDQKRRRKAGELISLRPGAV